MTTTVNIAKANRLHEPGYRYKREVIKVIHENFKGAVTRVVNLTTIAKQLQATAADLETGFVKAVKKSLAISTCGPLTFPGHRSAAELDAVLQTMVERFVLCPVCVLPEWNRVRCAACGYTPGKKSKGDPLPVAEKGESVAAITECQEVHGDAPWVSDIAAYMHKLYDRRQELSVSMQKGDLEKVNRHLDMCWKIETEQQWKKLKQLSW